jgi:peroxiredoxin
MSLKKKLAELNQQIKKKAPEEVLQIMDAEIDKLAKSGIIENALKIGDSAPEFELQNSDGDLISLNDLLQDGSVVISFNRGNWCGFCTLEFKQLQNSIESVKSAGGNLIVISPQIPEKSKELKLQNGYAYPILYDKGNLVAKKFRVSFVLPETLRPIHKAFHMDIPVHNGNESYELPLAATYVINQNKKIVYAYVNANWMERAEQNEYLNTITSH